MKVWVFAWICNLNYNYKESSLSIEKLYSLFSKCPGPALWVLSRSLVVVFVSQFVPSTDYSSMHSMLRSSILLFCSILPLILPNCTYFCQCSVQCFRTIWDPSFVGSVISLLAQLIIWIYRFHRIHTGLTCSRWQYCGEYVPTCLPFNCRSQSHFGALTTELIFPLFHPFCLMCFVDICIMLNPFLVFSPSMSCLVLLLFYAADLIDF